MFNDNGYIYAKKFFQYDNSFDYDKIVKVATLGRDKHWKKKMVEQVPPNKLVLELASGTGILSSMLLENNNKICSIDLTFDYIRISKLKKLNYLTVNGTAEFLPFRKGYFDVIIASYLPKYVNLEKLVNECFQVLKDEGIVIFHDFTYPKNKLFIAAWKTYFYLLKTVGIPSLNWSKAFEDLDKVIINSKWHKILPTLLYKKGFKEIKKRYYTFETSAIISAKKT